MSVRVVACSFAVFILFACLAGAQEPVKPPLSPRVITATNQVTLFSGLEKQLLQAIQKKDKSRLESMLSDDFEISMPNADPLAGEDWTATVLGKDYNLKSFIIRQMSVADLGNAAVVSFDRVQEATLKGKSDGGEYFVVDLWKKDGDTWKLANRYVSKVSATPWIPKAVRKPTGKQ